MQFAELNPKMMKIQEIDVTFFREILYLTWEIKLLKNKLNASPSTVAAAEQELKNLLDKSNKSL